MKINPLKQGILTEHSAGVGTVDRGMVRQRAMEVALINGRSAQEVSKSDWEQAKRELTGEPDIDPVVAALEATNESELWDPVPGTAGHQTQNAPSADEDEDGRSDSERLVEEGIAEAGHDQMLKASQAEDRKES